MRREQWERRKRWEQRGSEARRNTEGERERIMEFVLVLEMPVLNIYQISCSSSSFCSSCSGLFLVLVLLVRLFFLLLFHSQ
jgi:hypothetical protein